MLTHPLLFAALVVLAGCASEGDGGQPTAGRVTPAESRPSVDAWRATRLAQGRVIYERACASCHNPGTSAAPSIGARQDWDDRSRLWTAVLFEHAKNGYLEMPAKGNDPALSDKEVDDAAEYILSVTYPELPID